MRRKRQLENRQRLVDGALALLRGGSYRDLTVDRLARSVHMSKSTLYKHFRDKEALVEALVLHAAEPFERALLSSSPDALPRHRVRKVLEGWQAFGERAPPGLLLSPEELPPAAQRQLVALRGKLAVSVAHAVEEAGDRGRLKLDSQLTHVALVAAAEAVVRARARGDVEASVGELVPLFWQPAT